MHPRGCTYEGTQSGTFIELVWENSNLATDTIYRRNVIQTLYNPQRCISWVGLAVRTGFSATEFSAQEEVSWERRCILPQETRKRVEQRISAVNVGSQRWVPLKSSQTLWVARVQWAPKFIQNTETNFCGTSHWLTPLFGEKHWVGTWKKWSKFCGSLSFTLSFVAQSLRERQKPTLWNFAFTCFTKSVFHLDHLVHSQSFSYILSVTFHSLTTSSERTHLRSWVLPCLPQHRPRRTTFKNQATAWKSNAGARRGCHQITTRECCFALSPQGTRLCPRVCSR